MKTGIRVRKAYGIGQGKLIPYDVFVINQQDETGLTVQENGDFFPKTSARHLNLGKSDRTSREETVEECQLFECPEPGCQQTFSRFQELEIHIETGDHGNKSIF